MKVLLRADGNGEIGYGHLSRLNAFAEIIEDEFEISFLTREHSDLSIINDLYSKIIIIPNDLNDEEEISWLSERFHPENHLIIADGYQFNSSYQKKIKDLGYKLIFIDDEVKFHMHADCVINHAIGVKENKYSGEKYVKYFLGSEYALLRNSFIETSKSRVEKELKFETAFVSFGGTDSSIIRNAVNALLNFKTFKKIYVVAGKSFTGVETIKFLKENIKTELFIDINEKAMFTIMNNSDFAIVPSSTISYELASSRCIIASGFTTDNQLHLYKGLKNKNIIFALGDISNFEEKEFSIQLEIILTCKKEVFQNKVQNQIKFFDGNQKERLINIINSLISKS